MRDRGAHVPGQYLTVPLLQVRTLRPILAPCRNAPLLRSRSRPKRRGRSISSPPGSNGWALVQAADKSEAIEKAAKEFRLDPAKLMAERQR
jgi:hypothetical protein